MSTKRGRRVPGDRTMAGSVNPNGLSKSGNGIRDFPAAGPSLIPGLMKRPRAVLPMNPPEWRWGQPRVGRQRPSKRQPGKGGRSTY